jgi:HEAT repeat protein
VEGLLSDQNQIIVGLENALKNLVKLIKAVQYYPPTHPSLKQSLHETAKCILALIVDDDEFICGVRKDGFYLGDKPVGHKNPILAKLAPFLFARRINHLMFLPDLDINDLQAFARCLTMEATEVQKMGGIHDLMMKARVSTIWVNMVEPAQFMELKKEIEAQKEKFAGDQEEEEEREQQQEQAELSEDERNMEKVLRELQQEAVDQRFRYLLQELIPHIHLNLTETGRPLVLEAINFLAETVKSEDTNPQRREYCDNALEQLASEDILDFLVAILCSKDSWDALREAVMSALVSLKGKIVVWRLMDHLAEESDGQVRKSLAQVLIRQGTSAMPVLYEYLDDDRWFVVRNSVAILGEIRREEATEHLQKSLGHRDVRVRRETIRALTKIGGTSAIGVLLRMVVGNDTEMSRQALLSLGAMKNETAVPTLIKAVKGMDNKPGIIDIKKDAIKALGEIGSAEALPALIEILNTKAFWRRALVDEVRAAAALAMAGLRSGEVINILREAMDDKSDVVARAAAKAYKQLKRNE